MAMTEFQVQRQLLLAWFAGILDGEGTISIKLDKRDTTYHLRVEIEMSCEETIKKCKTIFGSGSIHSRQRNERNKKIYLWCVSGSEAFYTLKAAIPYMVTKKSQADCGIKFFTAVGDKTSFFLEMKKYNLRGFQNDNGSELPCTVNGAE